MEVTALAHTDFILILDETFEAGLSDRDVAELVISVVMSLSQQREKARKGSPSPRSWRCYFLSTSNFSLDVLAQRGGVALNDAHRSRLTEIPLPASGHGIYEELHGFASGESLTDALVPRCRRYFGGAGFEFQKRVVADYQADASGLRKWLGHRRKKYRNALKALAEKEGLTPLKRSTGRCATVYAAGALAIKFGILPGTKKELLAAILSCQLDGLRVTRQEPNSEGKSGAVPAVTLKCQLITWLEQHQSEFLDLDKERPKKGSHEFGSVPGYTATFKGKKWLYLTADQLREVIGSGARADQLKRELADSKLLERAGSRYVVQRPIFSGETGNKGYQFIHAFKATILENDD